MLGMCAVGTLASGTTNSRRRVHSPAAINAAASRPPRKMRTPGPISPASMENCTMKMPPSASAIPPIHTTQLAPKRSSKLGEGGAGSGGSGDCGGGGGFGGVLRGSREDRIDRGLVALRRRRRRWRHGNRGPDRVGFLCLRLWRRLFGKENLRRCLLHALRPGIEAPVQQRDLGLERGHALAQPDCQDDRNDRDDGGQKFHEKPRSYSMFGFKRRMRAIAPAFTGVNIGRCGRELGSSPRAQPQSWCRTLRQYLAAKAKQ